MKYVLKRRHTYLNKVICFLFCISFFFLFFNTVAQAANMGIDTDRRLNGSTDRQTTVNEPGTAETADDLNELNIANDLRITYNNGQGELAGSLRILLILTGIALAPLILLLVTSFTRILIVMYFTRAAMGVQTVPPNQVMLGLALVLTFFIMKPVLTEINENALQPFDAGDITQEEAIVNALDPLREFMYKQTQTKDVQLFLEIADMTEVENVADIPTHILIPSFVLSELRTAFTIGFVIYIPFIVIDMVVASTLMSMGMMMLPPTTISMPFKILLFVLADGWNLVIGNLVKTFY